jgi:hypothetical protein
MDLPSWLRPVPTSGSETWHQLAALVEDGSLLLHGSRTPGLKRLLPVAPTDMSPDAFSKETGVFATEDPTYALAYALRSPGCRGLLNACLYPGTVADVSRRKIFVSYGIPEDGGPVLAAGAVYAVPTEHFMRMPAYEDPDLGTILECQWLSPEPVPVVAEIPVTPDDYPGRVNRHDAAAVATASAADPRGFPWLTARVET